MKRRQFVAGFAGTIVATLGTAAVLGLKLPPTLIGVADRVIE
jgi:hypothetical protein